MAEKSIVKNNFINYINGIVKNHSVSHAYLVEVNNYEDDLNYIYHFIKMILCDLSYEEVEQSTDPILQQIDHHNYPDITVVSTSTSVINKSLLTDLQKDFSNKSILGGKRIYMILEAEKLNGYSANTILKFLEEPEEDIIAFLITDNRYHVIDTILSRCQVLSLKEEQINESVDDEFIDFVDCIIHPKNFFIHYNTYIKDSFSDKNALLSQLLEVENALLSYLENSDKLDEKLSLLLSQKNSNEIVQILSIIEDEIPKLKFNVNLKLWCDSLFSRLIGG